jgi:hypothetical protein
MKRAFVAVTSLCVVTACSAVAAAQTPAPLETGRAADRTPAMPIAAGVMGGFSGRGPQVNARVNVGLGWMVSVDGEVGYWGWSHFDDQNHLTVGAVQVRIGPRYGRGWHVTGLVGIMGAFNTDGRTASAGVGFEREFGNTRVCIDAGVGMFTGFVRVGVLFGPQPQRK